MAKKKKSKKSRKGQKSKRTRVPPIKGGQPAPPFLINHDIVIYDYDIQPGRFFTEPAHPVVVTSDGVHRIRFWNESSSDIEFTFVPPLNGRGRITILRHGNDQKTRVRPSDIGRHHYKPERLRPTTSISASASSAPVMVTLSAGDPEIIVE
jgi:hypothetical protein